MGYSYDMHNRLVCCECGNVPATKHRCAFGSCPAAALCRDCWKRERRTWTEYHRQWGCELRALNFRLSTEERQSILDSGMAVRCAASSAGENRVHVLFAFGDGSTIGRYMDGETYHAIPLLANATIPDYEQLGALQDAPATYCGGATSKAVPA